MEKSKKKGKKKQSKFALWFKWPLIVLVVSFSLSMAFGILSEIALTNANIIVAIVVVLVFLVIAIITDMIGVAIAACDTTPFRAMAAKKIRGAKEAIILVKNADRVSSIIADILGDVCSILSGAAGTTIAFALISASMSSIVQVIISSLVSAVIAALIISGKAFMKRYSLIHCEKIILILGKFISIFHISKKSKKKVDKQYAQIKDKEKSDAEVVENNKNANENQEEQEKNIEIVENNESIKDKQEENDNQNEEK